MKKLLLSLLLTLGAVAVDAEELQVVELGGKQYQIDELITRQAGPGIVYSRLRIPDYPLNVNMIRVDLTNPYNRIETMQASETLYKTESLVAAAKRYTTESKRVIGGANANFWCVATQEPYSDLLIGATYNGNLRNGQIITETNAYSDQWDGGPSRTGVIAIDTDKNLYVESMNYKGWAKNDKIGSPEIIQVNKVVRDNEIALYNKYYGTGKSFQPVDQYKGDDNKQHFRVVSGVATEVYLTVNEGESWLAGQDMACTVGEIKTDAGTGVLGSYDLCLVGRGSQKDLLAQLAVGDQVTINCGWSTADGSKTPLLEQLVGGNAIVMQNGELTGRNTDETYNSQVYSRTGYGKSADGKTLYIIVIDKSTDPVYGTSAGCGTSVMCEIARFYGCTDMVTMDAGGSAQMLLHGAIVNKTTESAPRAVANGWMVYSIAPQDDVIARLEFVENDVVVPPYSNYQPKLLGYNQYGDLIDDDVQGFTLSCDESLGTCDGMIFTASGNAMQGQLTASLGGVSCSAKLVIEQADIAIRIQPMILIDATRQYSMEVTATIGQNVYSYNPANIDWVVADETIATINENGVLQGLKEGSTQIIGQIGEYKDTTSVTVEIAAAAKLYPTDFNGWTIKSTLSGSTFSEDGTLSFSYGSPRDPYVTISKAVRYYSLPDKLWLHFTSSIPLLSVDVDLRSPLDARANNVSITPAQGDTFAVNVEHRLEIPIETPEDLIKYPLTLNSIKFKTSKSTANKGDHTIKISEISAEYNNYTNVENVIADKMANVVVYPNPVTDGVVTITSSSAIENVSVYSISGMKVASVDGADANVATLMVDGLPQGLYLVNVKTLTGMVNQKIVVR